MTEIKPDFILNSHVDSAASKMAAGDIRRVHGTHTASACGLTSSGHDYSVAAGNVMFSDILTSCLKNGPSATSHAEAVGSLDLSKLPAVSFAAMRLEIGSWQFIANTKDAVSATCCYAKRLLSWQVAEAGQKNKIELQWADITSLRVTPMGPATELLEVDVQSPPALFQETSPAIWQRCHDFTGGEASCLRTQKVLFPANTVMNLLQDLVTREPRLAAKLTTHHQPVAPTSCTAGSAFYPSTVLSSTSYPSLPCLQTSTAGLMPSFCHSAPSQSAQLPLYPSMYLGPNSPFSDVKEQAAGLSRGSSILSNLSCATAQPQLSSECLSSTNSEGSILNGLASSPCYQSSYSSAYINPFQAPNSPTSRLPVTSSSLGNSALLEQTAAMMKAATAALQSLQAPPQLYHSSSRQQSTQAFTSSCPPQQACYASQAAAMHAVPVQNSPPRNFVAVHTAPSVASMGMQALEELMMSDSSQDSSPFTATSTLPSVQSAPASFFAQAWGTTAMPCPSQQAPAQAQQEAAAQHSMSQVFENFAQHDATPPAAPTPSPVKTRALKRSVSDITVFDCKAAAAVAAREAATKTELAVTAEATQAAEQEAELAELDLPLIDDYFLADMGSSDMDSDLTSGLSFDAFADFQQACPSMDRSDSSSNLLAEQALLQFPAEEEALPAPKGKGKQSKKLKARGGVTKVTAQVSLKT
ncbi:hypothetical protein ABBQ38_003532 [Trebouxia sp. C0009 RCD-2024]